MSTLKINIPDYLNYLNKINELHNSINSFSKEKRRIIDSLTNELNLIISEGDAENIIDLVKTNDDFYIFIDYKTFKLYFSCNLCQMHYLPIKDITSEINYLDHEINFYIENSSIYFEINDLNTIGFYLKVFNKNLNDINYSELKEFNKDGILKIIENVDKVKSIFE
jgi:hypothetical protein